MRTKEIGFPLEQVIFSAIFCIKFYTYWQNNPDEGECWASVTSTTASDTPLPGYSHVSQQFNTWFMWGFLLYLAYGICALTVYRAATTSNRFLLNLALVITFLVFIGGFVWFVVGCVIRWRVIGQVCAGKYYRENPGEFTEDPPYQWKSANWINSHQFFVIGGLVGIFIFFCMIAFFK